jgi:signal transduction histidine kinase
MSRVRFRHETDAAEPRHQTRPPDAGTEPFRSPGHRRAPDGPPSPGRRLTPWRTGPRRQRPIRVTLTVLLTIPIIALIALWAYAAITTIGPYIAQRNGQTVVHDIAAPSQAFLLALTEERADTLAWQSARGALPRTALDAQRARTDVTVSAFRAGLAGMEGVAGVAGRQSITSSEGQLDRLTSLRTQVDDGTISALNAFATYNGIVDSYFQVVRTQLNVSDTSVQLYQGGEGVVASGQALEMIGREAALVGGSLAAGGRLSVAEYRQYVQALDEQRFLEQTVTSPISWQLIPDPFTPFFASPTYQRFKTMEDDIAAAGAGARIPVSPVVWPSTVGAVLKGLGAAETTAVRESTGSSARVGDGILTRLVVVGGAGLGAVLIVAFLLLRFGNRITRELTGFYGAVRSLAEERLPEVVGRLSRGQDVDVTAEAPPLVLPTRFLEVARIADGFSAVQRTAVEAAVGQAELRKGVSNIFRSLARRNQSLLQRQLRMLDEMERSTEDPDALAQLFRLDHLTTRMRRQSEGLIILSGSAPGRRWTMPVPVIEVLRGAIGEIEDYVRVDLAADARDLVTGAAVADLTHLLAELIENAALYSPPHTRVQVRTSRVASGFIVEIEDRGLGIPASTLAILNERLARPPEFDLADSDQLGLIVVSRLAVRHGIRVTLRGSPYGGAAAIVLIPHEIVVAEEEVAVAPGGYGGPPSIAGPPPGPGPGAYGAAPGMTGPPPRPKVGAYGGGSAVPRRRPAPGGNGAAPGSAGSLPALPRRERQASLAPQLREAPPATAAGAEAEARAGRSAEQARALMASIQQGWRSGRARAEQADQNGGELPPDQDSVNGWEQ